MQSLIIKKLFMANGAAVAFLMITLVGTVTAEESTVSVTLKDAIRMAAEKNLDIKAELYNPAQAEADIRRFRSIYDPNLTLQTAYGESTAPSTSVGTAIITSQKSFNLNAGITRLTPWGGTLGLTFNNGWTKMDFSDAKATNEYYQNKLAVTINQPLLKNFGRENTELNISLASYAKEASLHQFLTRLTDIITQVRSEYFALYYLRENLEVNKSSLTLANKILDETRARVKAGVLPAMEILNAEFNTSTRESAVINAEQALSDKRDQLRLICQITEPGIIDPVDSPLTTTIQTVETDAVTLALNSRPELKQLRENLKSALLQERVLKNQTAPDLSFVASAGVQGIDSTFSGQWAAMGRSDYPVWNVGFTFNYPLGNNAAENDSIKSSLKVAQLRLQIKSQEESIANEVRAAIRSVRAGYKQLDVTNRGSAYAEEVLTAYIKKAAVGLATTKDVFDVQNNLVAAKAAEIQARVSYDNALTNYWKTTGEILHHEGVKITGLEANELYGKKEK